ncbi:MAG: DUF3298 and DUF4163 domain-containing protein [Treponema sp.]|jgi:hypothetical protein|nr:DUF3298 and DUF4163 domain-containing protein [Treponema sp.]
MKNLSSKLFLPVLFLCVLSCANNPSKKEGQGSQVEFITFNSKILYGEGQPGLNFNFVLPDIAENGELKTLLWDLFYEGQSPQLYSEKTMQEYTEQYRKLKEEIANWEYSETFNWEYSETFNMAHSGPRFLEFMRDREYFTGGAHGMREIAWFVIDTETNKRLLPRDLIPEKHRERFELSMENALRARADIAPGGELTSGVYFEDKIEIPGNFYFSAKGINFCWDPYEIAPYSEGPIQVLLKRGEISGYLNDLGKALAKEAEF